MTDFRDPQGASLRLSNAEREEAIAELSANLQEGRLTQPEFDERSASLRSAITRGDIANVFTDLPPQGTGAAASTFPPASQAVPPSLPTTPPTGQDRKGPLGGSAGVIATSLSPFIALVLFFLTGAVGGWSLSWLWFLLVPVTWVIVYGAGTRGRYRDLDRRR